MFLGVKFHIFCVISTPLKSFAGKRLMFIAGNYVKVVQIVGENVKHVTLTTAVLSIRWFNLNGTVHLEEKRGVS